MLGRIMRTGAVSLLLFAAAWGQAQEPVVTLIHPWAGAERELFQPVLEAAEEALGIRIEDSVLRLEDLFVLLPTQWAAGTAPGDVMFAGDPGLIRRALEGGHYAPLTDILDPADYTPGVVQARTLEGIAYGAPFTHKPKPGFFYRVSFFEEHGLRPPTTWTEFVELLDALAEIPGVEAPIASGNGAGWPLADTAEHFLVSYAGPQLQRELALGTAPDFAWDIVETVYKSVLVPMLEAGYFAEPLEWTTAMERWWRGDFGIFFMGTWLLGMVDDPDDAAVFTVPGSMGITTSVDYMVVNAHSDNLDAAMRLAQWLSTEGQVLQVQQGGHIATYLPAMDLELYPPAERSVVGAIAEAVLLTGLHDTVGGEFREVLLDQLKLLWVAPDLVDDVLFEVRDAWKRVIEAR
jgi:multiple sugar transport system substrate-binding protein